MTTPLPCLHALIPLMTTNSGKIALYDTMNRLGEKYSASDRMQALRNLDGLRLPKVCDPDLDKIRMALKAMEVRSPAEPSEARAKILKSLRYHQKKMERLFKDLEALEERT